jgi:hypothetical protein
VIITSSAAIWSQIATSSPSLARDEVGRLLHGQAKSLFDVGSAMKNTPVARKKNVAGVLGRDKYVLGIDNLHTEFE